VCARLTEARSTEAPDVATPFDSATSTPAPEPSTTREVLSEATKLFSQLGFSNVVRALRVRYSDGKKQTLDYEALVAEKQALEQKLKALQGGK
jgi:hypothetical protein